MVHAYEYKCGLRPCILQNKIAMASSSFSLTCLVLLLLVQAAVCRRVCYDDRHRPLPPSESSPKSDLLADLVKANANPRHLHVGYYAKYTNLTAAIEDVPLCNDQRVYIHIGPGMYTEKINIPATKDFITLIGSGRSKTTIIYNDTSASSGGVFNSATFSVDAKHFVAKHLTFVNPAVRPLNTEQGSQAVALRLSGDYTLIQDCDIISGQNTLFDHKGRHYIQASRIVGTEDMIFGEGRSIYKDCSLMSENIEDDVPGTITASVATAEQGSGFAFLDCYVGGSGSVYLGRHFHNNAFVVFLNSFFDMVVLPEGWKSWNDLPMPSTVTYAEYDNYGPGLMPHNLASYLTVYEAKYFLDLSFVNGNEWIVPSSLTWSFTSKLIQAEIDTE